MKRFLFYIVFTTLYQQDYLLWNRFGSCLSNGLKPEESLGAYREALRLRPTYTRAIHNVGVACLNIGMYQEAAEHFLSALALQGSGDDARDRGNSKSSQLWMVLNRTFYSMVGFLATPRTLFELTELFP